MKLRINLHTGTHFLLEWEPMESGRFYAVLVIIGLALVLGFFLGLISLLS